MSRTSDPTPFVTGAFALSISLHAGLIALFAYADPKPGGPVMMVAQSQLVIPLDVPLPPRKVEAAKPPEPPPPTPTPSEPLPPPPPPPMQEREITAGIDDGAADTPTWLGFKEETPHKAPLSPVEQSALSPAPGVPLPIGAPPSPVDMPSAAARPQAAPQETPRDAPEPKSTPEAAKPADEALKPEAPSDAPPDEALPPPDPPGDQRQPPEVKPVPVETPPTPEEPRPTPVETPPAPVESPPTPQDPAPAPVEMPPVPPELLPAPVADGPAVAPIPEEPQPGPEKPGPTDVPATATPVEVAIPEVATDASEPIDEEGILPEAPTPPQAPPPSLPPAPPAAVRAPSRPGPLSPAPLVETTLDLAPAVLSNPTPSSIARPRLPIGAPAAGKGAGEKSDSQSDASAIAEAVAVAPGRVKAHKGLRITTVRPEWSVTTRLTTSPKNPVVRIVFGRGGHVISADFVKGQNTGFEEVDGPLKDALYRWTAKGEALDRLPPHDPLAGVSMSFRVLLRPEDPLMGQ